MEMELTNYYRILAPRPTVLVTSLDREGNPNAAPMSYVAPISSDPPIVAFSTHRGGDTYKNIKETEEFVLNITTEDMVEKVHACGESLPREESELEKFGLETEKSEKVKPPTVAESPGSIECSLEWMKDEPDYVTIAGRVVSAKAEKGVLKEGKLDAENLKPLLHLSGRSFIIGDNRIDI